MDLLLGDLSELCCAKLLNKIQGTGTLMVRPGKKINLFDFNFSAKPMNFRQTKNLFGGTADPAPVLQLRKSGHSQGTSLCVPRRIRSLARVFFK